MKKSLLSLLVFALVFTMVAPAFAATTNSDVVGTDYEAAVSLLSDLNVLQGYPDGTFKPDNTITRAEFAAVGVRLLGLEGAAESSKAVGTKFNDVRAGHWATGYINIAVQQGLLNGYPDGSVKPDAPVTQAEALTILLRALGYEPAVSKTGWPNNYIVAANQTGLSDGLQVAANAPATRGFVALASDNALTIPKLVQVWFGSSQQYVVSGNAGTTEETLLVNNLGVKVTTEVVVDIPRTDSKMKANQIELATTGKVTVPEGFDAEAAFGTATKVYYKNNAAKDVVRYSYGSSQYDAVEYDAVEDELTLVGAEETYDLANSVTVWIDGSEETVADLASAHDYAKVVLNSDGDVRFIEAFDWEGSLVVDEYEEDILYGTDDFFAGIELDVEDFTFVKEGKTISAEDLEKNDVVYFNEAAQYAEVYNNSVSGELSRVFTDSFRVDGTTYSISAGYSAYVDADGNVQQLDSVALEQMAEAEEDVTVVFDRNGDVRLVLGELEEVVSNTFYGYVLNTSVEFTTRTGAMHSLDVKTSAGEVKEYNVSDDVASDNTTADGDPVATDLTWGTGTDVTAGKVVKITVNEDDEVTSVFSVATTTAPTAVNTLASDATYHNGYRITSSTPVFWSEKGTTGSKLEVTTWGKVAEEFNDVEDGVVYVDNTTDRVVAIDVKKTDLDSADATYKGFVTASKQYSGANKWEITVEVNGSKKVYDTASNVVASDVYGIEKAFIEFTVGNTSGLITGVTLLDATNANTGVAGLTVSDVNLTNASLNSDAYELVSGSVIYDTTGKQIKLRDLKELVDNNTTVQVDIYFDTDTASRFVKYVEVTSVVQ